MTTKGERLLFWTKVPDPTRNGALVSVKVYVDIDESIEIAHNAARNKTRKATRGPIRCEALSGDIDLFTGEQV